MGFYFTLYGTWKILAVLHNDNITTIQLQAGVNSNLIINETKDSKKKKFFKEDSLIRITVTDNTNPTVKLQVESLDDVILEQDVDN